MQHDQEHEDLLASIHLSSIATVITDARRPDNPICAANRAFELLTGFPVAEILGRNCRFLRGTGSEDDAAGELRAAVREARPAMAEIMNYRRDGTPFRNAVMIAPVFDGDGELCYFIGSQMEVPERPAGDDRTAQARLRVARLSVRQQEVLTLMSRGLLNKQIGFELGISEKTVKMHRAALLSRLEARASADAVRIAVEAGL